MLNWLVAISEVSIQANPIPLTAHIIFMRSALLHWIAQLNLSREQPNFQFFSSFCSFTQVSIFEHSQAQQAQESTQRTALLLQS